MKLTWYSWFVFVMLFCCIASQAAWASSDSVAPAALGGGLDGAAFMHGDSASSDTTPLPGPGVSEVNVENHNFLAACPTILIRSDGKPFVLSTTLLGRNPVVRLLGQASGEEEARLQLEAGTLLGGVYAYLDHQDRLVMVDGKQTIDSPWSRKNRNKPGR